MYILYIYTRIFGPRFARPRFFVEPDDSPDLAIPWKLTTLVQERLANARVPEQRLHFGTGQARNVMLARTNGSELGTTPQTFDVWNI